MANIEVTIPVLDATQSIEVATITPASVSAEMTIEKALDNKNNSLVIVVNATTGGTLTLKAGDEYPNAILGDLKVTLGTGTSVIRLQDISRFENKDGSVVITNAGVAGTIFATAKRAGLEQV